MNELDLYALRLIGLYAEWGKGEELGKWRSELAQRGGAQEGQLSGTGLEMHQASRYQAAETMFRECLAIREKRQPDAWSTFSMHSLLGGALLGQKKYADAEPLLLAGYEGMKQREKTIPPQGKPCLPEALDRLIELYTATDMPDEVKKWQAERAKYPAMNEPTPVPVEPK